MSDLPTPIEFIARGAAGDAPTAVFGCPTCRMTWQAGHDPEWARTAASRCCSTVCEACGGPKPIRGYCSPCQRLRETNREAAAFTKATKITDDYDGPVYDPVADQFHSDLGALEEWVEQEDAEPRAYVWACHVRAPTLDGDDLIRSVAENHHEDIEIDGTGVDEFVAAFNARQTGRSWEPDYSRAIVLGGPS